MGNKVSLFVIVLLLLVIVGGTFYFWRKGAFKNLINGKTSEETAPQTYVNFGGDYSFLAPAGYSVDDTTIPGAQLIVAQNEKLQVDSVDQIYSKGAIAIQAFSPALSDQDSFKNYINNVLKGSIETSLKGKSEVAFGQKDGYTTAIIKTSVSKKLVRVQFIVNTVKPVIVASADENSTYKAIVESLDVASKKYAEFANIQNAVMTYSSLLKNRMPDDIYRLSSTEFKGQSSLDKLKESISQASVALDANISVSGGVIGDDKFTAPLLFTKPATKSGEQPKNAVGSLSLQKEDGQWKVGGITLPSNDAFGSATEE